MVPAEHPERPEGPAAKPRLDECEAIPRKPLQAAGLRLGIQGARAIWVGGGEDLRIVVRVIGFNFASAHPRLTGNQAPKA